jgi:hypothetical protein
VQHGQPPDPRQSRIHIGRARLIRVLKAHGIANARTLEQKISDAGPPRLRVHPHLLGEARQELIKEGRIIQRRDIAPGSWFQLSETPAKTVAARLQEQLPIYRAATTQAILRRTGQALEIAIYRALLLQDLDFQGRFLDLPEHDDQTLYSKEGPLSHIGRRSLPGREPLDFLVYHPDAGWAGIEAKNVRPWIYPHSNEISELLRKCVLLDCVPVLIARRIAFAAFKILTKCGVLVHETYNQRIAQADAELAAKMAHKNLLGYHDIRTGNAPDTRLIRFITINLPALLPTARAKFDQWKDLLREYAVEGLSYNEFVRALLYGQDEPPEVLE